MARRIEDRKKRKQPKERNWHAIHLHVQRLGFGSVREYRSWCAAQGFKNSVEKTPRQREQERCARQEALLRQDLSERRRIAKRPHDIFAKLCEGKAPPIGSDDPVLGAVRRAFDRLGPEVGRRRAYLRLLTAVAPGTKLLSVHPVVPALHRAANNCFVDALAVLAAYHAHWLRPPEAWRPESHNADRQFGSLARHLLVHWDVPGFLDSAWFQGTGRAARRYQDWYVHLGRGGSLRTAEVPIALTRRMTHEFLRAPDDLLAPEALRWAQVRALGGDERLARAVLGTRLRDRFEHDAFWTTVVRFFVEHPLLDRVHVGPIVDFIHNRKFVRQNVFVRRGVREERPPEQPDFSMKGRSPTALLREVESWHRALGRLTGSDQQWESSGLPEFRFVEKDRATHAERRWIVREILDAGDLRDEGRALHHCVGSYVSSCAGGHYSVWSVRVDEGVGVRRVLTVQVEPRTCRIVQARGKYNAPAAGKAARVMRLWAGKAGLVVAAYVER